MMLTLPVLKSKSVKISGQIKSNENLNLTAFKKGSTMHFFFKIQLFESYSSDYLSTAAKGPRTGKVLSSEYSQQLTPCQ